MAQTRENNPNWRGGRSVTAHGYVLIRVGTKHHLADVRGYAYEHRLVAEKKIGRRLRPGEMVHHIDGNKQNNVPGNLKVVDGQGEHFVHHRKPGKHLRMPGEPNPIIGCKCGCGKKFKKYDATNRPRTYVSGHNPIPAPVADRILEILSDGPMSIVDIYEHMRGDRSKSSTRTMLSGLKRRGLVDNPQKGVWCTLDGRTHDEFPQ